jgi:cobalamin biosynthesis protein CobT
MIYEFYFANLWRENQESDEDNEDDDEVDDVESSDDDDRSQSDDSHDESDQEDLGSDQQDSDENEDAEEENDDSDTDTESDNHASATVSIELRRRPIIRYMDMDDDEILNNVSFSKYRDEIVINQRVDLHSRLPGLNCASRRLLSNLALHL